MKNICRIMKRKCVSFWAICQNKKYKLLFRRNRSRKLNRNKKIYYIIRRYPKGAGFFSNYICVLSHMAYAREMKYTPVVDMEKYPTLYSEKKMIKGTKNAWEYYFCQADGSTIKEAYKSKNYILSESGLKEEGMHYFTGVYFFPLEDGVEFYYNLCRQIKIEKTLEEELENESRRMMLKGGKTLGVHVRGTDMSSGKYKSNHPQSLSAYDYIEMARRFLMEDDEIERIFLATDEESTEKAFKEHFGDKVYTSDAYRAIGSTGVGIHYDGECQRENHHYLLGKEVVRDAYLLAQCDKLLCGFSNVASVAIIWNQNRYEKIGVLCRKEYGKRLSEEIAKRENINGDRYIIKAI